MVVQEHNRLLHGTENNAPNWLLSKLVPHPSHALALGFQRSSRGCRLRGKISPRGIQDV